MRRTTRRALTIAAAAAVAAPLGGCYSASGTQLGRYSNDTVYDGMAMGDSLGAAMFQRDVQIAAANARRQYESTSDYATVNVPTD